MNRGGRAARSSASHVLGASDPRLRRNAQAGATENDIGDGLELDSKGRMRVALDPYGPFYYKPDGSIALRVDGVSLIVAPGSPVALRAGETRASQVVDDSGTTTNVADSIRRIIAAIATANASLAALITIKDRGTATLVAGTVTVSTTSVTTGDLIFLSNVATGGTIGVLSSGNVIDATSFDVTSSSILDTSTVAWMMVSP